MSDEFGSAGIRERVLASWAAAAVRFREDANAEEDLALGGYLDRVVVELAQNAADAAVRAGVPGRVRFSLRDGTLVVANTGTPLSAAGVESLATLRASAKRDDAESAVGRFGVGFAAVLAVTDEPVILSRTGGVRFSRADTAAAVGALGSPGLDTEVRRRDGHVPVLRLPFSAEGEPPEGFDTAVILPLRDEAASELVRRLLDEADDALLLALPGLERIEIEVDGEERVLADVLSRWTVQRAAGTFDENDRERLLADRPIEERSRPHWSVLWALPRSADAEIPRTVHAPTPTDEPLSLPALLLATFPLDAARRHVAKGPLTDHLVHEAARAYAELLQHHSETGMNVLPLVPTGLAAGALDRALRDAILAELPHTPLLRQAENRPESFGTPLDASPSSRSNEPPETPADLPSQPWAGDLPDTRTAALAEVGVDGPAATEIGDLPDPRADEPAGPWADVPTTTEAGDLPDARPDAPLDTWADVPAGSSAGTAVEGPIGRPAAGLLRPRDAVVVEGADDTFTTVLATMVPGLVRSRRQDRLALDALGVRRLDLAELIDQIGAVAESRLPEWWRETYGALSAMVTEPLLREALGTLPVPLADGRLVRGVRGLLLPGPDLPDDVLATFGEYGVRVVHPDAVHETLERLGALPATPRTLLEDSAVRAAVENSTDADDPATIAAAVLGVVAVDPAQAEGLWWLSDLVLRDADGEWVPANALVIPGSVAEAVLDPDEVAPIERDLLEHYGTDALEAVGVLSSLGTVSAADVSLDELPEALADLDGIEDWADDVAPEGSRYGVAVGELVAVRDLDWITDDAWPRVLELFGTSPELRRALVDQARVVGPDDRAYGVPSYAAWWIRERVLLEDGEPLAGRADPEAEPVLASLLDAAPEWTAQLDPEVRTAVGFVRTVADLDADGVGLLLDRLADPGREIGESAILRLWQRLGALTVYPDSAPDRVRVLGDPTTHSAEPMDAVPSYESAAQVAPAVAGTDEGIALGVGSGDAVPISGGSGGEGAGAGSASGEFGESRDDAHRRHEEHHAHDRHDRHDGHEGHRAHDVHRDDSTYDGSDVGYDGSDGYAGSGAVEVLSRVVAAGEAVVADAPMWLQREDLGGFVVASGVVADGLSDLFEVPMAGEVAAGKIDGIGTEAEVPPIVRELVPQVPDTWWEHEELTVDGYEVSWWVDDDGAPHAATFNGLAKALAWSAGRWDQRHVILAVLSDPARASELRVDATFDTPLSD
ncbi:hypothetical protein Kfla_4256 [Kribbella flavida DSM 17836]|uniref:ATP-binding region ATPase domain protein n=1 Tax=Kribbella flavida (strain DSM 17836 / JCM 10339 / NBRC 14399) TaxID=479435 RepID=D2PU09_KRIFD|nr:hypothetical protein [Kribbella flavida]ADB33292.1 hypothetical protein Kfla_4256 [Kribbella flavida DSM 17836]